MDNQITFIETVSDNFDDLLLDKIKKCFDDNRFPYEDILIRKNINDISYLVTGQIFFKKLEKKGINYLLIKKYYKDFLDNNKIDYKVNKATIWLQVKYQDLLPVFDELMLCIYESVFSLSDFSCCSRYEMCSDAKQCVQPNKLLGLQCSYRKKLEKGIIFYGKNKTI